MSERVAPRARAGLTLAVAVGRRDDDRPVLRHTVNDLYVYRTYADLLVDGQLPYLDFGFEYPPLAAMPLWLGRAAGRPTRRRMR